MAGARARWSSSAAWQKIRKQKSQQTNTEEHLAEFASFVAESAVDETAALDPATEASLTAAEALLGLDAGALKATLAVKTITTAGKTTTMPLTVGEAASGRDGLAKALYGLLFEWIVQQINLAIESSGGTRLAEAAKAEPGGVRR